MKRAVLTPSAWAIGLAVLLSPFFFVLYRLELFNTLPRDDYAPYLLWLDGNALGAFPDSPYAYRLFSVALAWPLLHLLPAIPLSNIPPGLPLALVRATAAIAALSYLATIGTALLTARLARVEGGLDRGYAIIAGGLAWVLCWYTQITAIDAVALLLITAALNAIRIPRLFALVLLVSAGCNEKVALTLAIWLGLRCLLNRKDRHQLLQPAIAAFTTLLLYGLVVAGLRLPGNSYQLTPASIPVTVLENLHAYLDPRGALLNVLPTLILAAIAAAGTRSARALFARTDILVIPGLMLVALALTHLFQAGRLVMHAAPLFIVPAIQSLRARGDAHV